MSVYNVTNNLNPSNPLVPLNLDIVNYIIIHHPEAEHCTWQDINEWHKQQGWNCAGYNEFIDKDGDVFILRGDNIGAQCLGMNSTSYGICCEGNYQIETEMPEVQKQALIERIKFNSPRFPNYKLTAPHKQFVETQCPGINFPLAEILQRVEKVEVGKMEVDNSPIDPSYKNCVDVIVKALELNSPQYWLDMKDGNVKILIQKMANYISTQTTV